MAPAELPLANASLRHSDFRLFWTGTLRDIRTSRPSRAVRPDLPSPGRSMVDASQPR